MTREAEKYADEDEKYKETIQSKNELEGYCFSMKSILGEEKVKEKLEDEEIKNTIGKIDEVLQWIEGNQLAEKEEFIHKKTEVEEICKPVMSKLNEGMSGQMPAVWS